MYIDFQLKKQKLALPNFAQYRGDAEYKERVPQKADRIFVMALDSCHVPWNATVWGWYNF